MGQSFPNIIKNLSSNDGFSQMSAITTSANNVYVVWEDTTASVGNFEILVQDLCKRGNNLPCYTEQSE